LGKIHGQTKIQTTLRIMQEEHGGDVFPAAVSCLCGVPHETNQPAG